jgi:hypothetical protein
MKISQSSSVTEDKSKTNKIALDSEEEKPKPKKAVKAKAKEENDFAEEKPKKSKAKSKTKDESDFDEEEEKPKKSLNNTKGKAAVLDLEDSDQEDDVPLKFPPKGKTTVAKKAVPAKKKEVEVGTDYDEPIKPVKKKLAPKKVPDTSEDDEEPALRPKPTGRIAAGKKPVYVEELSDSEEDKTKDWGSDGYQDEDDD